MYSSRVKLVFEMYLFMWALLYGYFLHGYHRAPVRKLRPPILPDVQNKLYIYIFIFMWALLYGY